MLRVIFLTLSLLAPTIGVCETLTLSERSITFEGVTKTFVLEVDIEVIESFTKFNPAKDEPPLTIKQAVNLVVSEFKKKFNYDPFGVASVTLQHFPNWNYSDRWYFSVDLFAKPGQIVGSEAAVLFNGKVIFPREL